MSSSLPSAGDSSHVALVRISPVMRSPAWHAPPVGCRRRTGSRRTSQAGLGPGSGANVMCDRSPGGCQLWASGSNGGASRLSTTLPLNVGAHSAAGRWQSGRDADATSRIAARTEPCVADRPRILTAAAPPSRRRQRGRHQRPQRHCRHVTPRQWPEALTIQCWLSELPPEHNVGSASDSERWRLAGYPFEDRPSTVSSSARIRRWPLRLRSPRSGNSTFVPTAHVGGGASRLLARRSQGAGTPAKLARTSEKRPGSRCHPVS